MLNLTLCHNHSIFTDTTCMCEWHTSVLTLISLHIRLPSGSLLSQENMLFKRYLDHVSHSTQMCRLLSHRKTQLSSPISFGSVLCLSLLELAIVTCSQHYQAKYEVALLTLLGVSLLSLRVGRAFSTGHLLKRLDGCQGRINCL